MRGAREAPLVFPLASLVPRALAKTRADGTRGVVVIPFSPSAAFWPGFAAASRSASPASFDPCIVVPASPSYVSEAADLEGAQRLAVMAVDFSRGGVRSDPARPSRLARGPQNAGRGVSCTMRRTRRTHGAQQPSWSAAGFRSGRQRPPQASRGQPGPAGKHPHQCLTRRATARARCRGGGGEGVVCVWGGTRTLPTPAPGRPLACSVHSPVLARSVPPAPQPTAVRSHTPGAPSAACARTGKEGPCVPPAPRPGPVPVPGA